MLAAPRHVRSLPRLVFVVLALLAAQSLALPGLAYASSDQTVIASLVNGARAAAGLPALRVAPDLAAVAQGQSAAMAGSGTLYHNPNLATQVTNWTRLSENVGYGPRLGAVHDAFMASAGHRANILDRNVSEMGIGVAWSGSTVWVTEVFRQPTTVAAVSAPATVAGLPDVFVTIPGGTGSGAVEVHGLSGDSAYSSFAVHAATALAAADPAQWTFQVAPYHGSGQPDLFAIKRSNTGSGMVEVHVLSAASGYRDFVLHAATSLPANDPSAFTFVVGSLGGDRRSNLFAIKTARTTSGRTEVHVLGEVGDYRYWVLHSTTALPTVDATAWTFLVGDRFGMGDLIGVLRSGTSTGRTEVHAMSVLNGYRMGQEVATPLGSSPTGYAYALADVDRDGRPDLVVIKTQATGTGTTEVHALSAASSYGSWILDTGTALSEVPSSVSFSLG